MSWTKYPDIVSSKYIICVIQCAISMHVSVCMIRPPPELNCEIPVGHPVSRLQVRHAILSQLCASLGTEFFIGFSSISGTRELGCCHQNTVHGWPRESFINNIKAACIASPTFALRTTSAFVDILYILMRQRVGFPGRKVIEQQFPSTIRGQFCNWTIFSGRSGHITGFRKGGVENPKKDGTKTNL